MSLKLTNKLDAQMDEQVIVPREPGKIIDTYKMRSDFGEAWGNLVKALMDVQEQQKVKKFRPKVQKAIRKVDEVLSRIQARFGERE